MKTTRHSAFRRRTVALLVVFGLIGVACSEDDDNGSTNPGTAGDTPDDGTEVTTPPDDPGASDDATIRIALASDLPSLDAHLDSAGDYRNVYSNVFETLVEFTPEGDLSPELAAELPEQVEDTVWRVKLREGVAFSNGEPFNADAVVLNIDRLLDTEFTSPISDQLETTTSVTKVDDYTVDIHTDGVDVVLPRKISYVYMMAPSVINDGTFDTDSSGTGPYVVDSWDHGSSITLVRNDGYWGDAPPIAKAEFKFLPDPGTRVAALLSGEVDVVTNLSADDSGQVPQVAASSDRSVIAAHPSCAEGKVTADANVRRAMLLGVDRESITTNLLGGDAELAASLVAAGSFGFDPSIEPYPYDPEQAKQLITDAGAEGGHVSIVYDQGRWPQVDQVVQVLQQAWSDIGLDAELSNQDGEAYLDVLLGRVEHAETTMILSSNEFFDASLVASKYMVSDSSRVSCPDAELDQLLTDAIATSDEAVRADLYSQAVQIVKDEAYELPIAAIPSSLVGMAENVVWVPGIEAQTIVKDMSLA